MIALREPDGHVSSAGSKVTTPRTTPAASHSGSRPPAKSSAPATHGSSPTSSGSASNSPGGTASLKSVPLVVLNNTTITGLAAQVAGQFRSGGWTVTSYTNYQNDIISTCAYYNPSVPNAQAAAQALQAQFPAIKRVEPQFSELSSYNSPIVVILTPDYSS